MVTLAPDLIAQVARSLEGPCGAPAGAPVVAACSGGADSVALVHLLARVGTRWPLAKVVFIDHGLRDVGAEREAAARAAADCGQHLVVRTVAPGALAGNLQGAARQARYRLLLAETPEGGLLATGHTADDQVETLLQRLLRGVGIRGLAGIHPRQGRIIRPLLGLSRATTRGLGLPFADDPTNTTARFLRNRLRLSVIPRLAEESPHLLDAMGAVRDAAAGEFELVEALLDGAAGARLPLTRMGPLARAALLRHLSHRLAPDAPPTQAAIRAVALGMQGPRLMARNLGNGLCAIWRGGQLTVGPDGDRRPALAIPAPGTYTGLGYIWQVRGGEGLRWPLTATMGPAAERGLDAPADGGLGIRDRDGVLVWPGACRVSRVGALPEGSDQGTPDARDGAAAREALSIDLSPQGYLTIVDLDS